MNYFIDFEATQFSEEIISVGCIREDGETFYALVAPVKGKITPFITNLTGITAEMLETAFSAEQVFESFYDWAFSNPEIIPNFYVWGNSDCSFIQHTYRNINSLKARMALGYIAGSMKNYAKVCKKYLKWATDNHGLLKTLQRFNPEAEQNHNALDDAVMLKQVYDFMNKNSREQLIEIFNDWSKDFISEEISKIEKNNITVADLPTGTIYIRTNRKKITQIFASTREAATWLRENKCKNQAYDDFNFETTMNKIIKSCRNGSMYYNIKWRMA